MLFLFSFFLKNIYILFLIFSSYMHVHQKLRAAVLEKNLGRLPQASSFRLYLSVPHYHGSNLSSNGIPRHESDPKSEYCPREYLTCTLLCLTFYLFLDIPSGTFYKTFLDSMAVSNNVLYYVTEGVHFILCPLLDFCRVAAKPPFLDLAWSLRCMGTLPTMSETVHAMCSVKCHMAYFDVFVIYSGKFGRGILLQWVHRFVIIRWWNDDDDGCSCKNKEHRGGCCHLWIISMSGVKKWLREKEDEEGRYKKKVEDIWAYSLVLGAEREHVWMCLWINEISDLRFWVGDVLK